MARKFHFYQSHANARGNYNEGSLANGSTAHLRGWNAGVKVSPRGSGSSYGTSTGDDEITLAMTGGSRDDQTRKVLGTIRETGDGPVWEPAGTHPDDLHTEIRLLRARLAETEAERDSLRAQLRALVTW